MNCAKPTECTEVILRAVTLLKTGSSAVFELSVHVVVSSMTKRVDDTKHQISLTADDGQLLQ